jgi:hypothetical protein
MGHVPYVGFATSSRANATTRFTFVKKKKKKGRHTLGLHACNYSDIIFFFLHKCNFFFFHFCLEFFAISLYILLISL